MVLVLMKGDWNDVTYVVVQKSKISQNTKFCLEFFLYLKEEIYYSGEAFYSPKMQINSKNKGLL